MKYFKPAIFILLIIIAVLLFLNRCEQPNKDIPIGLDRDSLVNVINSGKVQISIAKAKSKLSAVTVTIAVDRWNKAKHDTVRLPCDTVLKYVIIAGDTMKAKFEAHIVDLNEVITRDSVVISDQDKLAHSDSLTITRLRKEVRRAKLKTRLVLLIWAIREGVGLAARGQ